MSNYITYRKAINRVRAKIKDADLRDVHIISLNVFPKELDSAVRLLDKEPGRGSMRVTSSDSHNFIVKYMPSFVYQAAINAWNNTLMFSLAQLTPGLYPPGWVGIGGTTFTLGPRIKEADAAIGPTTTSRPSVVLEVGNSETLTQLRIDARLWLEHMPAVEIVILISISPPLAAHPNLPRIEVELWRAFQATRPQPTPAARQREARMVWSADWTLNAQPLYILLADIFNGQVPAAYGNNDRAQLDTVILRQSIVDAWAHQ